MIIASQRNEVLGVNVYLKPTYAFIMPARSGVRGPLTDIQKDNMKNLERNQHDGKLSVKAQKKLVNSVNWLVASAKKKWIFDKTKNKYFSFKVNFITLTLPGDFQMVSDHHFKSILMHSFINACRYRYNLRNFVWKVEAQANGKIHAHFTTDTFLPWQGVREIWNRILSRNGLMKSYTAKHSKMTLKEYNTLYNNDSSNSHALMKKRFTDGVATGWTDPNSTDVHAVYKVKDIGAYLAKYMSKKEEDRRGIAGRLWSCSYNIAQANSLSVNVPFDMGSDSLDPFFRGDFDWMEVFAKAKGDLPPLKLGEIFFFKLKDLVSKITGPIGELYRKTLFNIRHGVTMEFDKTPLVLDDDTSSFVKSYSEPIKPTSYKQLYLYEDVFTIDN